MILDGFGVGLEAEKRGDAIKAAKKPNIDKLFAENPVTKIGASGLDVYTPSGPVPHRKPHGCTFHSPAKK